MKKIKTPRSYNPIKNLGSFAHKSKTSVGRIVKPRKPKYK
jgi:hypothetical protein